ncbi:hypothetical protein JCM8208_002417 [Rhodotorula glutinis]
MAGPALPVRRAPHRRLLLPLLLAVALICSAWTFARDARPRARRLAEDSHRHRPPVKRNVVPSSPGRLRFVQGAQRTTQIGATVQRACGELEPGFSEWISTLEQDEAACDVRDSTGVDMAGLVRSARQQCGSWCVWDLATSSKRGWHLSNGCWARFASPHYCDEWWYQRPGRQVGSAGGGGAPGS